MIIITLEFIAAMGVCKSSYDWAQNFFVTEGITQCTYQFGQKVYNDYCKKNPIDTKDWDKSWMDNLPTNPKVIMYFPDWKYLSEFKLLNIFTNVYDTFTNLSDAQAQLEKNKTEYIDSQKNKFSVNQDVDNPDGSTTWIPVDPFTFDKEDDYQVFDVFSGQYTFCSNLAEAQATQRAIEEKLCNAVMPPIQQQIASADGNETAWVNI